jgi:hypothetical protein
MAFAHKILSVIYHEPGDSPDFRKWVNIFRIFNAVIILSFLTSRFFADSEVTSPAYTLFSVVIVLYLSWTKPLSRRKSPAATKLINCNLTLPY